MLKIPHFFKAESRIGLINPPLDSKFLNLGVENASDKILDRYFLRKFKSYRLHQYEFPKPENIDSKIFHRVLSENLASFKDLIGAKLVEGEIQTVVGGDDCVSLASILAVLKRAKNPRSLGYLRFDSHADMNLYRESPTKNFHGMYHRPLVGDFDIPQIARLVENKLVPGNILFLGNLVLDKEEAKFFKKKNFTAVNRQKFKKDHKKVLNMVKDFAFSFDFLHLGFDIDVLDSSVAPATGIPSKNGFMLGDVYSLLGIVLRHPRISVDLVEVNPQKRGGRQTVKVAQDILYFILGS